MSPSLLDGDYVLIKKARSIEPGSIFLIDHIDLGRIIKRLKTIENERLLFAGDNSSSVPEAVLAPVSKDRIQGRAWLRISPQGISRI